MILHPAASWAPAAGPARCCLQHHSQAAPRLCPASTGAEEPNQVPNPGVLEMGVSRAGPRGLTPGSRFLGLLCSTGSQTYLHTPRGVVGVSQPSPMGLGTQWGSLGH